MSDVVKLAADADQPKPPLMWNGREVKCHSVGLGVHRAARKMSSEDGTYHVMIHALRYVDTGERVFKNMEEVDAVPNIDAWRVMKLARAAVDFNKPRESDAPDDIPLP